MNIDHDPLDAFTQIHPVTGKLVFDETHPHFIVTRNALSSVNIDIHSFSDKASLDWACFENCRLIRSYLDEYILNNQSTSLEDEALQACIKGDENKLTKLIKKLKHRNTAKLHIVK